jgi:sulfite exporter TauE/SafE
MPANIPVGMKILLGLGTILIIIGIVYFYVGTSVAKESILSFDKGIAYFVFGIAVLLLALTIFIVVEMEDIKEQLERIKKK